MDLYEYQARDLFDRHGVPVPPGALATTPEQARRAAQDMFDRGSRLVVVKAQVKTGGRGKAGGVKPARTAEEAGARAAEILGMDIKGHPVRAVLGADGVEIASELYVALLLDRAEHRYLVMCSREGGMDIETLAAERPEALARIGVDPLQGVTADVAARVVRAAGFEPGPAADAVAAVIVKLWGVFTAEDATLVEVNPLVLTPGGDVLALDGKVSLDDNAAFRHPERAALKDTAGVDPLEARAKEAGLNYVRLDGNNAELGRRILAEAAIDGVRVVDTMDGAADVVTAIAQRVTEHPDAERRDAAARPDAEQPDAARRGGEQRTTAQHTAVQQGA